MATSKTKEPSKTKMKTGRVRASYAHVWVPQAMEGSEEKKYSIVLLIPKKDKKQVAQIEACIEAAIEEGKSKKWNGKLPKNLKLPLRDGDEEREGKEEFEGMWFITASGKSKPGIIGLDGEEITERDEFYSGIYCKAAINFYPFSMKGNNGVAVGLNNLLSLGEGERLAGGASAKDDFAEDLEEDL